MCTLSWIISKNGYELFFNRDEQRTRQKAIIPALNTSTGIIMPTDPESRGTWIACNHQGETLCLLNNYQKQATMNPHINYISRGKIIPEILSSVQQNFSENLKQFDLKNYLPFYLCHFPGNLNTVNSSKISIYQWNGEQLTQVTASQPFISSGVLLQQVQASRRSLFTQIIVDNGSSEQHITYHRSHLPDKNHLSVCMHREDARTQSLSHISVSNVITFRYHDGPPCENNKWSVVKTEKLTS